MSKNRADFVCIVGNAIGNIKVVNGYNLKEENQIKLDLGSISQIKKQNDQYFVSADETIYCFDNIFETENSVIYTPTAVKSSIVKFDFIENGFVVCYKDEVHIVNDNIMVSKLCGGLYDDVCLLRNKQIAVGGEKTELTVYDTAFIDKPIFVGKTEANKALSLPAKIHITSLAQDSENDSIVYCGTKFNTVQLYDIRSSQRKAVSIANFDINFGVKGLLALTGQRVLASSSRGTLGIVDFRYIPKNKAPTKNVLSRFEKFSGTTAGVISDMAIGNGVNMGNDGDRKADILVTTSFDRQLRVYDLSTRLMLDKMYLGSKGTCVLIDSVNRCKESDLWDELEKLDDEKTAKRQGGDCIDEAENKRTKMNNQ